MISSVSSVIIAVALGLKAPLLAPVVFLLRFIKREVAAFSFLIYCVLLGYEFSISELDELGTAAAALAISTVLLLEESMSRRKLELDQCIIAFVMPICLLEFDLIVPLLILAVLILIWKDRAKAGILAALFGIAAIYSIMNFKGTEEIVLLASLCIFLFLSFRIVARRKGIY